MRKLLITMTALLAVGAVCAQTVTTFAGSRYTGRGMSYYNNNQNATLDSFSMPWGIYPDTSGKFWVTDQHMIRIIIGGKSFFRAGYQGHPDDMDAAGYFDGTGNVPRFNSPHAVAVNPTTNDAYMTDFDNNTVRKLSKFVNTSNQTIVSTLAGKPTFSGDYADGTTCPDPKNNDFGTARLNGPADLAISTTSNIYVADSYNHCIRKIYGNQVTTVAGKGTFEGDKTGDDTAARFSYPSGLFLEDDNNLLIADRNNGKIKRLNLTTKKVTTVVAGLGQPTDVVSVGGVLYIADKNCIRTWDGSKIRTYVGKYGVDGFSNASDSSARFGDITLLSYDYHTKSIYIADMGNNVFRKVPTVALPTANFWANKTSVSVNEVVTLHSSSTYANQFQWTITPGSYTLENGSSLTDSVVYVSFSSTGSYTVTLKVTNSAGNNSATKNNYINVSLISSAKPTPDFYADKTTGTVDDVITMIEQSGNNPTSWSWAFTPNTVSYQSSTSSTSRFPKVKFTNPGLYTVELTATNTNGSNVKSRSNYVNITVSAVVTPGVAQLSMYPNPAASSIQLAIQPLGNVVEVISASGAVTRINCVNQVADVSGLAAGVYVLRCLNSDGLPLSGRIVKIAD